MHYLKQTHEIHEVRAGFDVSLTAPSKEIWTADAKFTEHASYPGLLRWLNESEMFYFLSEFFFFFFLLFVGEYKIILSLNKSKITLNMVLSEIRGLTFKPSPV